MEFKNLVHHVRAILPSEALMECFMQESRLLYSAWCLLRTSNQPQNFPQTGKTETPFRCILFLSCLFSTRNHANVVINSLPIINFKKHQKFKCKGKFFSLCFGSLLLTSHLTSCILPGPILPPTRLGPCVRIINRGNFLIHTYFCAIPTFQKHIHRLFLLSAYSGKSG